MKSNTKSRRGFTLIELLIVIGILAVLAAIAIPSISGIINRARKSQDEQNIRTMEIAVETFASEARTYTSAQFDLPKVELVLSTVNDGSTDYLKLLKNFSDNKFTKEFYPATPLGFITTVESYSNLRGTKITIPAETGMDFYYNADTGLIIKAETEITSRETLKDILLKERNEDDLSGRWINITAVIGKAEETGIDNRIADEDFVKSYAGNDGGNVSEKLADFCYITTDGYIGLTDDYKGGLLPEKVVLPKYFQGIEVKGIRDYGFKNATGIKHIVLSDGMIEIKAYAFASSSIEIVEFSSTISKLNRNTFTSATKLKQIIVPSGNSNFSAIGTVLYDKTLSDITLIPGTKIYETPDDVTNLNSITNFESLNKFVIGKNVTQIHPNIIRALSQIDDISVHPDSPNFVIENGILYNKNKTEVVRVIKDGFVNGTFNVPENVTILGYGFLEGINCEVLNIHKNVSNISEIAFLSANQLKEINVDAANPYYKSIDGILFNNSCTKLLRYPPKKVFDASKLPNTLTTYSYRCMANCSIQGTFTFGPNITSMDSQTFAGCSNLTKVVLNEKLNNFSLNGAGGIKTVVVNGANTKVSALLTNNDLNFVFNVTSNVIKIEDDIIYSTDGRILYAIIGNNRDVIIKDGVTTILGYSLYNKTLKTLYIPSSVTRIESEALGGSTAQKILFGFDKGKISGAYWGLSNSPSVQYNVSTP